MQKGDTGKSHLMKRVQQIDISTSPHGLQRLIFFLDI